MPFTIDENSLLIKGRKGDSATFNFNFNQNLSDYNIYFYVKKNLNNTETIIEKLYSNPNSNSVTVHLTEEDTKKFVSQANSYSVYYWGLKIKNGSEFVQTIIPKDFKNPPMMYIYAGIGGV